MGIAACRADPFRTDRALSPTGGRAQRCLVLANGRGKYRATDARIVGIACAKSRISVALIRISLTYALKDRLQWEGP